MTDFKKDNNIMHGKGEKADVKWITVNGAHIPLKDGQSPKQAIQQHFEDRQKPSSQKFTSLEAQVDAVLNGTYKDTHITMLEETPKIFQEIGVPNKPILMTSKHAYLAINKEGKYTDENDHYHDLGKDLFCLIPGLLQSPMMILRNNNSKDEIVAVLNWFDKNKNILIMPIKIDGKGNKNFIRIQANIAKSVYGKNNFAKYINTHFTQNDILAVSNKKIRGLNDFD